jgi:hypothetical protein
LVTVLVTDDAWNSNWDRERICKLVSIQA